MALYYRWCDWTLNGGSKCSTCSYTFTKAWGYFHHQGHGLNDGSHCPLVSWGGPKRKLMWTHPVCRSSKVNRLQRKMLATEAFCCVFWFNMWKYAKTENSRCSRCKEVLRLPRPQPGPPSHCLTWVATGGLTSGDDSHIKSCCLLTKHSHSKVQSRSIVKVTSKGVYGDVAV